MILVSKLLKSISSSETIRSQRQVEIRGNPDIEAAAGMVFLSQDSY